MHLLKADVVRRVAEITQTHFGLHGQGLEWYEGAPWYTPEAQVACRSLAEDIRQNDRQKSGLFKLWKDSTAH
jgi:hypothetical protein